MAGKDVSSTYIYRQGTSPNTRAAISQKNKIFTYTVGNKSFMQLGAMSEFGHDESRNVEAVRGIGFGDQIAELVPGVTEPMTLTINKTLLYSLNLFQVFGYKGGQDGLVRSLKHHRWPFDIKQELVFSELSSNPTLGEVKGAPGLRAASTQPTINTTTRSVKALITIYEGCWMTNYSASYTVDAGLVSENSSVMVTDIIDGFSKYSEYIDAGLAPLVDGQASAGTSIRFNQSSGPQAATNLAGF